MSSLTISDAEYRAATEACGVVDRSDRGKLALTGADTKPFLQGQVSNDVEALTPGTGCYAAFLTPKGKMLGDVRILDTGEEILLDTERVSLQELFNIVRRFSVGYAVELHKRTVQRGLVSLLGPQAEAVAGIEGLAGAEHTHLVTDIDGIAARAIRTDLGIDLLCDAQDTEALTSALTARGGVSASETVADCVRVEHGRPATAWTSMTASSPRRPTSTTARSRSPRGATWARRRWPAFSTAASPTASCAG